MKHFTKQNRSLCSLHGKIGIQMNNTVYTSKEKNYQFSSKKKPSATKHSPQSPMFITWNFIAIFLFEYSLMGIVKPKFTRRNEIWCTILKIEDLSKNVRKTQDWMSLKAQLGTCLNMAWKYGALWCIHSTTPSLPRSLYKTP